MRLEISEAISLILAIPAHRSNNEGHRRMGEKALDLLIEYKDLGIDDNEKSFNRAMISSVLSAVRAFSVERDRISGEWKAIEAVRQRRERLIDIFRNISPLTKGNYWAKALLIIFSVGLSLSQVKSGMQLISKNSIVFLIIGLILLELLSKTMEYFLSILFEKKMPIEKAVKWQNESLIVYKSIIDKFIDESIESYKKYYPDNDKLYGYLIDDFEQRKAMKLKLINLHFYL